MKFNLILLGLVLIVSMGASACGDYDSPEAAMGTLNKAVAGNDLSLLRDTLVGNAKKGYGSPEGLVALQIEAGNLKVYLGPQKYLGSRPGDSSRITYYWYRYEVLGQDRATSVAKRLKTATVFCRYDEGRVGRSRRGEIVGDIPSSMDCRVSDLN